MRAQNQFSTLACTWKTVLEGQKRIFTRGVCDGRETNFEWRSGNERRAQTGKRVEDMCGVPLVVLEVEAARERAPEMEMESEVEIETGIDWSGQIDTRTETVMASATVTGEEMSI